MCDKENKKTEIALARALGYLLYCFWVIMKVTVGRNGGQTRSRLGIGFGHIGPSPPYTVLPFASAKDLHHPGLTVWSTRGVSEQGVITDWH